MRGKKRSEEMKRIALNLLAANENAVAVAEQMNAMPELQEEIKQYGRVTDDTVQYWLTGFRKSDEFKRLKEKKAEQFADKADRILDKLFAAIEDSVDKAREDGNRIALNQLATTFGILYDKRALAKGEATQIQDVKVVIDIDEGENGSQD